MNEHLFDLDNIDWSEVNQLDYARQHWLPSKNAGEPTSMTTVWDTTQHVQS